MAQLTDDQKVLRNSTGLLIRAALLTIAEKLAAPLGLNITGATPGQVPVIKTVDANGVPTSYEPGAGGGGTANALPLAGGTMQGNINMDGNRVQNLPTPSASGDAVPKSYADGLLTDYRTASAQDVVDAAQDANITSCAKADEIGIVITGARPSMVVSAGQYVIVRGSTISGITDGLYKAVNALSPGTDVTAADLSAVSGGGLNSVAPVFSVETTYLTSKEVAAGSQVSWNESIARAGKTPVAIVGLSTNRQNIYILAFSLSASTETAYLAGKNTSNSAITASGAYFQVLYIDN